MRGLLIAASALVLSSPLAGKPHHAEDLLAQPPNLTLHATTSLDDTQTCLAQGQTTMQRTVMPTADGARIVFSSGIAVVDIKRAASGTDIEFRSMRFARAMLMHWVKGCAEPSA